ncbi:unnamed protein product [Phytomonas sp. Hart1]|nr:unnamed protein product [Phytomonas sp. Hart1]|eukprot:CCW66435.1 unnamed protein product [Phytomonas sp. isolate Hart1]
MTTDYKKTLTSSISPKETEHLIERLYTQSIERKKAILEESERRYYPIVEPQKISAEKLQKSIERQVDHEMALRQARAQQADASLYGSHRGATATRTLTTDDIASSVSRLYDQSLEKRNANMAESQSRYMFHPPESKKISKKEIDNHINVLSKPRKTEYTIDEINRIYGLM